MSNHSSPRLPLLTYSRRFAVRRMPHSPLDRYKRLPQSGHLLRLLLPGVLAVLFLIASSAANAQDIAFAQLKRDAAAIAGWVDTAADPPRFRSESAGVAVPWNDIAAIKFPKSSASAGTFAAAANDESQTRCRFSLVDGTELDGILVELTSERCRIRVAEAERQFATRWLAAIFPANSSLRGSEPPVQPIDNTSHVGETHAMVLHDGQEIHASRIDFAAGRFTAGSISLAESDIAAVRFRRHHFAQPMGKGVHVKLWLARVTGPSSSQPGIVGRLLPSEPDKLILQHPALGQIIWNRWGIDRLEVLAVGDRTLFLPRDFHLGNEVRTQLGQVQPSGSRLDFKFHLDPTRPSKARISLGVKEMEAEQPGGKYEQSIQLGFLRTTVVVNGQTVDYLNRHLTSVPREIQRLRILLPDHLLVNGANRLELVQSSLSPDSSELDDCSILDVAIELEEAN